MENAGGDIDENAIIPELNLQNGQQLNLYFLIQYRQLTLVMKYLIEIYTENEPELEVISLAKEELNKGFVEKCAEHLEVSRTTLKIITN